MNLSVRGAGRGSHRWFDPAADLGRWHEGSREDLPREGRLSNQAQQDVAAFTAQIVPPLADLLVLQPLNESKGVEEHEQGDDDPDDEAWNLRLV